MVMKRSVNKICLYIYKHFYIFYIYFRISRNYFLSVCTVDYSYHYYSTLTCPNYTFRYNLKNNIEFSCRKA